MTHSISLKEKAKAFYVSRPNATLNDTATEFSISYETVRDWSKNGRWSAERVVASLNDGHGLDGCDQADGIRLVLFNRIVEDTTIDAPDLSSLVKAWLSLTGIKNEKETESLVDRDQLDVELLGN